MLDIETLRKVPLFSQLSESRLNWLLEQGTDIRLQPGDIHRHEGDLANCAFVLLEGEIKVTQKVDNQEVLLATYKPPALFGELPILMEQEQLWASGRAVSNCWIFELPKPAFLELLSSCTCIMTAIFRTMAQRLQEVQMISQQREKLVALGTLAAGLAHELNNPASASIRAVGQLKKTFQELQPLTLKFTQESLTTSQQDFLCNLQQEIINQALNAPKLDPLLLSDQEDAVTDWLLDEQAISNSWQLAPTLVAAGLDINWLNLVKTNFNQSLFNDVINWIVVTITEVRLLAEIERSTTRISTLVGAVKDYSYMDQAPLQIIDIHQGLESTLTMLSYKLKGGIKVIKEYGCDLPKINAYGSELNQVWTNLIDNAIDALDENSSEEDPTIWIRTNCEGDALMVEIADNGVGIPPEKLAHIFEPFFTTKGVGKGTGLGLHIAYRIVVGQHQGDIQVVSQPGDTRFQIRLPLNWR